MNTHEKTIITTFCFCGVASQGATVLNQADWDGIDQLNDGNNGASVAEVSGGGAPAGSNGTVASIDVSGSNVWGAVNPPGNTLTIPDNVVWDSVDGDEWHEVTVSGLVPEFENDGTTAVTGLTPILSFYDRTDGTHTAAGAGTAAFIDDWSFSVTTTVPEPSTGLAALLGLGLLGLRRRR